MSTYAKLWTHQFIDEDGAPFGLCYAEFFDATGAARKAVWTDRDKSLPSGAGSLLDVDGDTEGWIEAYGDGIYQIVIRAAGDDGSGSPIHIFYDVQLQDAEPAYAGDTAGWALDTFEEDVLAGQGRQAAATSAQASTTLDLSKFDVAGSTYLVEGTATLLTFQKASLEAYTAGARITLECLTNPIKLRAKRAGEGAGYNLEIAGDFLMSVGSSIDLELRAGSWYERSRFFFDASYENLQNTGVASASSIIAPGRAVRVTGTATVNSIYWLKTGELAPPGQRLDLYFTAGAVVGDNTGNADLEGTFTGQAGATLSLISTGTGWVELARNIGSAATTAQALGTSNTPSVAGTSTFYSTGTSVTPVSRLLDPGFLGRIITIVNGGDSGDDSPAGAYTTTRKTFEDREVNTEGYLSLQGDVDFGTTPGDTLTLQVQYSPANAVLFWREIARTMVDVVPKLASAASLTWWRPVHYLTNATGADVTVTSLLPVVNGNVPFIVTFFAEAADHDTIFADSGNMAIESGALITLNGVNEAFSFLAMKFISGGKRWMAIRTANSDVA